MFYDITERKANHQAHIRIETEMIRARKGLYTFVLRVNNNNIVDVVVMENESYGSAPNKK